jgi:hypothetical protein
MTQTPPTPEEAVKLPKPIGYAQKQPLLAYSQFWIGYSVKPESENGYEPVALYSEDQVRVLLATLSTAAPQPSGAVQSWKFVPVTPTDAMREAAAKADDDGFEAGRSHGASGMEIYTTMLAAAPQPPASSVLKPATEKEMMQRQIDNHRRTIEELQRVYDERGLQIGRLETALARQPAASAKDAEDAARIDWLIANPSWSIRWRIHTKKQIEQWQMVDDGESWGQWGNYRAVIDAAIATTKATK